MLAAVFSAGYIFRGTVLGEKFADTAERNFAQGQASALTQPNTDTYRVADPTPIGLSEPTPLPTKAVKYMLDGPSAGSTERDDQRRSDISLLGTAAEAFFTENNGVYPQTLFDLVRGGQMKSLPLTPTYANGADELYQLTPCETTGEILIWIPLESELPTAYYVYFTRYGHTYTVTQEPDKAFCSLTMSALEAIEQ